MAQHNEHPFESELCEHLADNGWLYSTNSTGYDKERALFPEDVFGWLEDVYPDEFAKVVKVGTTQEASQRAALLDRIVKVLDTPLDSAGGTLYVLRKEIKHLSAKFRMCEFKPETTLNKATVARYDRVRVRVMRQVYYSTANKRSVDLVLFINGLPVATCELKTDFTQSVQEAIKQYKTTRLPREAGHEEPLFGFGNRALVHFAVSNDEVWMTTHLQGDDTFFLPFNRGFDGGAGNPPNEKGSAASYLWEQVFQRDAWLNILGKFMHVEVEKKKDPITGQVSKKTTLLFPRYHQWDVVTRLTSAAVTEGPGHKYLVQHSAGSGKSNSIAWTAHRLARLHAANNDKIFDSVIVVTDRTVLDGQLQETIRQVDSADGVFQAITSKEAVRQGEKTKSALLATHLLNGTLVIAVTIQTFPFALDAIQTKKGLAGKKFAVIADEAHSSQTGTAASKLKQVLSAEEIKDLEDGGEIDTEAVLAAEMTARADNSNISYFAFTATPKGKTLELFGRAPAEGETPVPFHVYTMQQAIEEGFILDVLKGYHEYETAFQIAQKVKDGKGGEDGEEKLVDESAATRGLMRWVKLHQTNIGQKVQIIVEHFRDNVEGLLDGHAKAMVVTDSRKAAVRYKKAIDAYIKKHGYDEIGTLVAFSGSVDDPETGPEPFTEGNMNPGVNDLRAAFKKPEYKVMLVANKFQTGFDQPLLCAMYVDKQLSGVTAVQTLSRLNRMYRGKDEVFILDFVNTAEEIQSAFQPYYRDAHLETSTDPNLVHDVMAKVDVAAIYTATEIDQCADAWVKRKGNNALSAALKPAKDRFKQRYQTALAQDDKAAIEELDMFRKDVGTFVRLYDFMSQIIDYGDTDLEKHAIFLRLLERLIQPSNYTAEVDLSDVTLVNSKQIDKGKKSVTLGDKQGLRGITAAGSGAKKDPKMVLLEEAIRKLNDLFGDEDFTAAEEQAWIEGLVTALLADDTLLAQAKANGKKQFLESPDLGQAVVMAVLGNQTSHNKMADKFIAGGQVQKVLVEVLGGLVHLYAKDEK
ncbi:DEAD/DEAH box helicase family protein [Mycobacterium cookii]|uniref:DEAD/DEAH box helicase family protein n=1 Tax=Nocardioides furvisabuli TaxID=375542 RepID=A0ABN2XS09_9ACTN|nr:type I restriction endonuclease [Nocardioides furvisabuli]